MEQKAVAIPDNLWEKARELKEEYGYSSIADVVRTALRDLLEEKNKL